MSKIRWFCVVDKYDGKCESASNKWYSWVLPLSEKYSENILVGKDIDKFFNLDFLLLCESMGGILSEEYGYIFDNEEDANIFSYYLEKMIETNVRKYSDLLILQ